MKKKTTCYTVIALISVLTLAGCLPTDLNGPSVGGQPSNPNIGTVVIEGNLYDNSQLKLTPTYQEIGDLFKSKIDHINVWFGEDPNAPGGDTNSYPNPFVITVDVGGDYYAELSIVPAYYSIYVEAYHTNGTVLFWDEVDIQVLAGDTTNLDILLSMRDTFEFKFIINSLPGNYGASGSAIITTGDSSQYFVGYEKVGDILHFSSWLPLDFDGYTSTIEIIDSDSVPYITALNFDIFDAIDGEFVISYGGGVVSVDIGFEYETL
jgi:hypothetical protein